MADIVIKRTYTQNLEQAKSDVNALVAETQAKYPKLIKKISWNKDKTKATAKGTGFSADFAINKNELSVSIKLSLLVKPLKGKLNTKISSIVDQYFPG